MRLPRTAGAGVLPRTHLTVCVVAIVFASSFVASLAQAGRKSEARHKPEIQRKSERGRGTGGIPAVLRKLEEMQQQLEQSNAEIAELREQVATLDANVSPCTPERFRNDQCGPDNHPLDLHVTVCGGVGADAGIALKYAFTTNLDVQVGIGWKDAPDVHIVENAQIPALIAPVPGLPPIVLPSELAGQVDTGVGLGLEGCLAPIRVPVGNQLSRPEVIAILDGLEAQAQPIVERLTARLNGDSGNGSAGALRAGAATGPGMGLAGLSDALAAADMLRNQEIIDDDPMAVFSRGPIGNLGGSLPIGNRAASLLADPAQLALPSLRDRSNGAVATATGGFEPGIVITNVCTDNAALSTVLAPLCDFLETRIPTVDRLLDLIPTIEGIQDIANDAVDGVRELLDPLFADVGESAANARSRFCSSAVGQRRVFNGLCGR